MPERRKNPRSRVFFGGVLAFNDRSSTLDCLIRDFSPHGARLEMPGTALIPDRVALIVKRKSQEFSARIAWRGDVHTGLEFIRVRDVPSVIPFDPSRLRRRRRDDEDFNR